MEFLRIIQRELIEHNKNEKNGVSLTCNPISEKEFLLSISEGIELFPSIMSSNKFNKLISDIENYKDYQIGYEVSAEIHNHTIEYWKETPSCPAYIFINGIISVDRSELVGPLISRLRKAHTYFISNYDNTYEYAINHVCVDSNAHFFD